MNRVFIIHGWSGRPDEHWLPWLKKELELSGFQVHVPEMMPVDEVPVIEKWVGRLDEVVGELDEDTYFVGHSIGCQAIMRYLETQAGKKAGGCVFVAGWFVMENLEDERTEEEAKPWMYDPIDFKTVRSITKNFAVINSSNDDYGMIEENKKRFEENLGAHVTIMEDMGHFTEGDGVTELPEARDAILAFSGNSS